MPDLVFRHLFGEAFKTWLVVAGVLVFLTLGLGFAGYIADAAAGRLPVDTVLLLAVLKVVQNMELVMPVSVLLAVLLTLGRVCRDNEMAALMAGGVGPGRLYRPFFAVALIVAVLAGVASMKLAPASERVMAHAGAASVSAAIDSLAPGRFRTFLDGDGVFYAGSRDDNGNLRDIFIRVNRDNDQGQLTQTVVTAKRARRESDAESGRVTLVLDDGWRYEGYPGRADYRIIQFAEHGVVLSPAAAQSGLDVDAQSFSALWHSADPEAAAEWQTRVSVPLSIFILTLLALSIGQVPPRAGRYARVIVGVLFYVIYVNAVHLAAVAIEQGSLPAAIGVWWVHALVLALAVVLALRDYGMFAREPPAGAPA